VTDDAVSVLARSAAIGRRSKEADWSAAGLTAELLPRRHFTLCGLVAELAKRGMKVDSMWQTDRACGGLARPHL
jgi:hypothetical protein